MHWTTCEELAGLNISDAGVGAIADATGEADSVGSSVCVTDVELCAAESVTASDCMTGVGLCFAKS